VKLVDEVITEPGTQEHHVRCLKMLREAAEAPADLLSPRGTFDRFEMKWAAGHWIIETTKEIPTDV
jgi:hypothetical protein